jgi:ubiquinone/menaquinone biosynthesis C-methylase UbiE
MTLKGEYDIWHSKMGAGEQGSRDLSHPWHITTANLLPDLNGLRVLEIGCGRGDFALWLVRRSPQADITAIDFSGAAIDLAKKRESQAERSVRFEVGNAQLLRFDDDCFDLIISCECLEHVPDPEVMTREMYRVLKPGGRFVLTTENYCNGMVLAWIKSWLTGTPYNSGSGVQPNENFFVFWQVRRMLERSGLIVEHMASNHFQWLLLPRIAPSLLCTEDFNRPFWKWLFRPFGRHFAFSGVRPAE